VAGEGSASEGETRLEGTLVGQPPRGHAPCLSVETIEREEWLIVMGILADIRHELQKLNRLLRGDDDGEKEEEDEG
jgi:hypothetical protein